MRLSDDISREDTGETHRVDRKIVSSVRKTLRGESTGGLKADLGMLFAVKCG